MRETWLRSLGGADPLEKEMATHSSILAWRIPWTEEPGGLQSGGRKESDTTELLSLHFSLLDTELLTSAKKTGLSEQGPQAGSWKVRSPSWGPAATRGTRSHLHPIFALLFHTPSAFSPLPWCWLHGDLECSDVLYFLSPAKGKRDCKKKQLRPLGPFIIFGSVRGLQAW